MKMQDKYEYNYFEMKQPIGDLYCALIPSEVIIEISASEIRTSYNDLGIQRKLDKKRVDDIALFCQHSDAMFPTPIVLSASSKYVKLENTKIIIDYKGIKEANEYCGIIDGQHRLKGIEESNLKQKFELLVLFVFDIDVSTEAKLFSIINGKQKPIAKSLIYDLSRLNNIRTVEKVCSETVNYLNDDNSSELYHQIKILGYKEYEKSIISQSALVNSLIKLISKDVSSDNLKLDRHENLDEYADENKFILRQYFIKYEDEKIRKIVLNYLNAWIKNLKNFNILESLMGKTIGFNATFKLFPEIFLNFRKNNVIMSENNFSQEIYEILNTYIENSNTQDGNYMISQEALNNHISNYGSSESGANKLAKDLIKAYQDVLY